MATACARTCVRCTRCHAVYTRWPPIRVPHIDNASSSRDGRTRQATARHWRRSNGKAGGRGFRRSLGGAMSQASRVQPAGSPKGPRPVTHGVLAMPPPTTWPHVSRWEGEWLRRSDGDVETGTWQAGDVRLARNGSQQPHHPRRPHAVAYPQCMYHLDTRDILTMGASCKEGQAAVARVRALRVP